MEIDDADSNIVTIRQSLYKIKGKWVIKDTKTHQHRRIVPDIETAAALREHIAQKRTTAVELGIALSPKAFIFSPTPDGLEPLKLDNATQRYKRMAGRLGITTQPS